MELVIHSVCSAFHMVAIGTRVEVPNQPALLEQLEEAIGRWSVKPGVPAGLLDLSLPAEACRLAGCGVGPRTSNPEDYVLRSHRGRVYAFLKRGLAAETQWLHATVYTQAALFSDPECSAEDKEAFKSASHILVSLRAGCGVVDGVEAYRFVSNLAGGNQFALNYTREEIFLKAIECKSYEDKWCVVAD